MNKSLILLAIGSMLAAAISFLRLTQYRKKHRRKRDKQKQKQQSKQEKITSTSTSLGEPKQQRLITEVDEQQKIRELYENEVITKNAGKLIIKRPLLCNRIQQVSYSILLNLNKSKIYEGIVKIKIGSRRHCLNEQDLQIEYRGNCIHYLSINNKKVEQGQIKFDNHRICIQKQLLLPQENIIEIIFSNNYSFLGEGLTSYFPLDKNNKYSLKGQVIYTSNGFYKVSKILPCLNILNQCQVRLEVLHPNGFHAQSNSLKMLSKMVVKKDYPLYPFLFEVSLNSSLNSSRRLNNSGTSETTIKSSDEIIKVKSQFSAVTLSSIHIFFVFCSAIVELRPLKNLSLSRRNLIQQKNSTFKQILLRYFFKEHMVKKAASFLNILETQIQEILQKLKDFRSAQKIIGKIQGKIDIFFVNDLDSEGNFYTGAIILSQNSVERGFIDRRLHYLLSRAFVGIGMLAKKNSILTYQQICKLNQLTMQIFPECTDYLYVKNIEYGYVKQQYEKINQPQVRRDKKAQQQVDNQSQIKLFWIVAFFNKESKYLIMNDSCQYMKKVTPNVRNIISNIHIFDTEDFWTFFFSKYPFLEFNVTEIIISISLKLKGVPTNQAQLKFAQEHFIKSKHYLKFFPHRQIQSSVKKFLELKSYGLEKVLPFIKIKQSCLSMIPAEMEPFLPARQNRFECQKLYEQFKKFNEQKNFHHKTALNRQIERICLFLGANLQDQRIDINCGLSGWKLLSRLKIFPRNQENYQIIYWLSNIPDKYELCEQNMFVQKEWREDTANSIEDRKPNRFEEKTMTQQNNSIQGKQEMEYQAQYRRQRKESESRLLEEIRQVEVLLEIQTKDSNILS